MKICFLNYHQSQAMASRPPLKSSQQEIRAQACQLAWLLFDPRVGTTE